MHSVPFTDCTIYTYTGYLKYVWAIELFLFYRFADIRNTLQGKQEERLPFFSFIFPPWFKQAHPQAYANFVYNTQYLTSPFDVHKTLENILNFDAAKDGDRHQRAISLFDKVSYYNNLSNLLFMLTYFNFCRN